MPAPTSNSSTSRVLLTGASSGIGAALAVELARRGHQLWLGARRADKLADLVTTITAAGGVATAVTLDVSDHLACAEAVARLDDESGGFDIVVANAGVGGKQTSIWKITADDAKDVLDTNFTGALATILPLLPKMRARGRGQVVGVSSIAADVALPMAPVYGSSKAGLTFFLDSIATELAAANIAVTIVHPGFVRTPMTDAQKYPMPFMVEVDDAAKIIADAIEKRATWLRFPLGLRAFAGAANMLPRALRVALIRRSAKR